MFIVTHVHGNERNIRAFLSCGCRGPPARLGVSVHLENQSSQQLPESRETQPWRLWRIKRGVGEMLVCGLFVWESDFWTGLNGCENFNSEGRDPHKDTHHPNWLAANESINVQVSVFKSVNVRMGGRVKVGSPCLRPSVPSRGSQFTL